MTSARAEGRGVSDVLGFVFVFSLIVLTTGTAVVFGLPGLEDARDAEQVTNAERAFDVLAENVDDVAVRDAPGRGTEIRLAGARLGFGEPTRITVSARTPNGTRVLEVPRTVPITYTTDDAQLVYEGTAVFRTEGGGSATVRAPTLVATPERTLVTLVAVSGDGRARAGSGVVLVRTERTRREAAVVRNVSNVTIGVRTDPRRAGAWERTLEARTPGDDACAVVRPADGVVECRYGTETVAVTRTGVDASYAD